MLVSNQFGIGAWHPAVALGYFAAVLAIGFIVDNPLFQVLGTLGAAALLLILDGAKAARLVAGALGLAAVVALVNPLFNTRGETVLFTWWGGRPYTLEALMAGVSTALMLAQTLLWFASLSLVLTPDKLMVLFGRWAPSLTLVLTLSLRLVTSLRRKVARVAQARAGVGLGGGASLGLRVCEGGLVLGSVTAAAFEDGVTTADSMKSRGFGLPGRTRYQVVRFRGADGLLAGVVAVLTAIVLVAAALGALAVLFFPEVVFAPAGPLLVCAGVCYGLLICTPLAWQGAEVIRWRSIASSI